MKETKGFDPIKVAEKLRPRMIDLENKKVLLAILSGTEQAKDLTKERFWKDIFRSKIYTKAKDQNLDPFRGEPAGIAAAKLTIPEKTIVTPKECNATFFGQVNGCNLRCWQCFVDRINTSANPKHGKYVSAEEYLVQFLIESRNHQNSNNPDLKLNILRISGGEPFIVPEFIAWMIEAIEKFNLEDSIYFWVDSNLCTGDFYWRYLTRIQREKIRNFKNIGFMGCYKGFDEENFTQTCGAAPEFFSEQFKMHRRLIDEGLDVYTYLYPLTSSTYKLRGRLTAFIERLQEEVDNYAPLRLTTPLTKVFGPTKKRLTPKREKAIKNQYKAIRIFKEEMKRRFGSKADLLPHQIPVK